MNKVIRSLTSLVTLSLISCVNGTITERMPDPSLPPFSLADVPFTESDPFIDGMATTKSEWETAVRLPDIFFTGSASRAGFYYFQSRMDWVATSVQSGASTTYPGHAFFVAHDIVGSSDPKNSLNRFQQDNEGDWNSFEFNAPVGKVNIWVFDDEDEANDDSWLTGAEGLDQSHLIPEGTGNNRIIDQGFIARLNDDPSTDVHWFEGMPEPGDNSWSWADWHHVFGRHHFGKSFQDVGLDIDPEDAVPHEVYEFAVYNSKGPTPTNGSGDPSGSGDPPADNWCIWIDWVTIEVERKRRVIVIKDGSPRRGTLTDTVDVSVPVLRGNFWLHFFPPWLVIEDEQARFDVVLGQIDMAMETLDLNAESLAELGAAREAIDIAFQQGLSNGDYSMLFESLGAGYAHLDNAKSAGIKPMALGDLEVQILSTVATVAAERAMAMDLAGLPIDDPLLKTLYGGLYDFGQQANRIANGGEQDATPREAVEYLRPVFDALSASSNN